MTPPVPVVVGVARSGTTLLRLMLDSHPDLAIPPETAFLPAVHARAASLDPESFVRLVTAWPTWPDFGVGADDLLGELRELRPFDATSAVRCFYRVYAERFGKPRFGDKTPFYGGHMPAIEALLPEAAFVHLIRDGRDVAVSLRPLWFAPGRDVETLAAYWRDNLEAARRGGARCRRYVEVRYEELVREPRRVLRTLCAFLDLPWTEAMLEYPSRAAARLAEVRDQHHPDGRVVTRAERFSQHPLLGSPPLAERAGRWRQALGDEEQTAFAAVAGDTLRALGYETDPRAGR